MSEFRIYPGMHPYTLSANKRIIKWAPIPKKIIISRILCHLNLVVNKAAQTRALQTHLQIQVLKVGSGRRRQIKDS